MGRFYQFNKIIILEKFPLWLVTLLVRTGKIEHHIGSKSGTRRERSPFRCIEAVGMVRGFGSGIRSASGDRDQVGETTKRGTARLSPLVP